MDGSLLLLVIVIGIAVVVDFINGFHDTANAMATSIATRALRPRIAVGLCALLNFAGAFLSIKVAATISSGIVNEGVLARERLPPSASAPPDATGGRWPWWPTAPSSSSPPRSSSASSP